MNVVWYYLTRNGDRASIDKMRSELIRPLPGLSDEVSEEVVSAELDMFRAAMAKGL